MASSLCERKTENKAAAAAGSHTLGSWIWLSLLSVDLFAKSFAQTTHMLYTLNLATSQDPLYIIEVDPLSNLILYSVSLFTSLQSNHESFRNRS